MKKKRLYLHTGCTLLNLAITEHPQKGYAFGLIHNLLGSESSGKSLMCILACANVYNVMTKLGANYYIVYDDAERAFSPDFAIKSSPDFVDNLIELEKFSEKTKGLPRCVITGSSTIEEFYDKLRAVASKSPDAAIYVLDSYDALTSEDAGDIHGGSYHTEKTKKLSLIAGRIAEMCAENNILLIITSQIRDNINAMPYGSRYRTTGGWSLRFYSSLRLRLEKATKQTKKAHGKDTVVALETEFQVLKSRLGKPFRKGSFIINVYAGAVDDVLTSINYLVNVGAIPKDKNGRCEWDGKKLYTKELAKYIRAHKQYKQLTELLTNTYLEEEKKLEESCKFNFFEEMKELLLTEEEKNEETKDDLNC